MAPTEVVSVVSEARDRSGRTAELEVEVIGAPSSAAQPDTPQTCLILRDSSSGDELVVSSASNQRPGPDPLPR